jgi:N-sulfoglucosamine sulfohydrolase
MKLNSLKSVIILSPCILHQCHGDNKKEVPNERPNILIVIGDDISFPHMSAYGCSWIKTPGFDRVARDGILFNNAYTPNAKSSPSRACLLTGRNSWQLEEAANHVPFFPPKFTTFMESLDRYGYDVGYTSKGWAPGVALDSSGKARELTGKAFNARKTVPPTNGISNSDYAANFEDFLNSRRPGNPFCFWYGSTEPHRKYQFGSGVSIGGKNVSDIRNIFRFWPDNDIVRNDILDYAFEIEYFDSHLEKMLDLLRQRGELDKTIVIVTSDNGMPFPRVKGQVYEYSNHMPLAIMWGKGIKNPGRTIYDHISFIDFAPTILEVAGIKQSESGMQPIEGKSFTNIFFSRKNRLVDKSRDHVLIGKERHDVGRPDDAGYPVRGIVKDGFLYLVNFKPQRWPAGDPVTGYMNCDGSPTKTLILNMRRRGISQVFWDLSFGLKGEEELYYISADPECMNNLVADPGYNNLKQKLREQLLSELREQADPRVLGNGDIFDKYPYASESSRDFYNRYMKGELSRKSAGWIDSTDFEDRF